ncbi:hypothetical protein NA56DRAFT_754669, partial [Hyaloscypha hepaticicola]
MLNGRHLKITYIRIFPPAVGKTCMIAEKIDSQGFSCPRYFDARRSEGTVILDTLEGKPMILRNVQLGQGTTLHQLANSYGASLEHHVAGAEVPLSDHCCGFWRCAGGEGDKIQPSDKAWRRRSWPRAWIAHSKYPTLSQDQVCAGTEKSQSPAVGAPSNLSSMN